MNRWLRFYSAAMRDPKVLRLSDKDFRLWVSLLCVASENDGKIPELSVLKLMLGARYDYVKGGASRLLKAGLVDALTDGYEPHNWSKYQYKSDTSNDRVAKHRAKCNVTVTPPDTDTDTEEDTRVSSPPLSPMKKSPRIAESEAFTDFWKAYPKRTGKEAARKAWAAAVKRGASPEQISAAANRYAAHPPDDSRFIPHPTTWLNQGRYDDEPMEAQNDNRMAGNNGHGAGQYRRDPAWEGLKRIAAEVERDGGWGD